LVEVADSGLGIRAEERETIFRPCFTGNEWGILLGLPIARQTVEAHRGRVELVNKPAKGMSARIVLPLG
jgi:two-component system sensor histidine kinase TtrS